MPNTQINILNKNGTLSGVQADIKNILTNYAAKTAQQCLCSHEILGLASAATIKAIADGLANSSISVPRSGYNTPSSWIGSVAADLANNKTINQRIKHCVYTGSDDAAWY